MNTVHNSRRFWLTTRFFIFGLTALVLAWSPLAQAVQSVTTAWDRSTDSTVTGYKVYYTDVSASTTSAINAGNVTSNTVPGLLETKTYSFNVVAYNASGVESVPSNVINYTVPGANTAPTISGIADLSTSQNTATTPIPFTIGDAQTAAGSLILSRTSSNPTLIPVANIVFGGSGANPTVSLTPALNQTGTSTITVTVSDGSLTASDSFVLTVSSTANTAPTISSIADQTTTQNTATAPIAFTVGDTQTAAGSLFVSGASSNPTLVPVGNIVFGGSGANRTATVTPALNQTGTATITVTDSDGSLTASKSFVLTVNPAGSFTPVYLAVEAESATLVSPMAVSSDPNASGGQYIAPTANDSGTATFTINIPVAGTYSVWCKVLSPNTGQDSFFVTVDGGTEFIYETVINGGWSSAWQWTFVNADMVNPSVFNFSAGQHSIQFRSREAYTGLDQLLITNDPGYVPGANTPPAISSIADLSTSQNTATAPIAFTVGDAQTAAGSLIVSRVSSNPTLVPAANIVLGGSGANRTVTVTPALNQTGTATITLTVSDGSLTASDSFVLTVNATANTAPTISSLADLSTSQNTATAPIAFTVGDSQTAVGSLTVSGASANLTLVPVANIVFGGSGANRTVTVTPALNQTGTASITVSVSDGSLSASKSFVLTVNAPANTAPTISSIADQTAPQNTATAAIAFTVGDTQTAVGSLTVSGASSNPTLVPAANIVLGGSGANRTVTVTPALNQTGTSTITVTVSDGSLTASDSFVLTVNAAANTAPTISSLADLSTSQNTATAPIAFTVGDSQTAVGSLTVSGASANLTLVPVANIVFGGSGANRTVTVTPALNQTGTATITVTVSDGSLSASKSFVLTVNAPANTAPTISSIADQTTPQNTATAAIAFTVGDSQTAVGSLTVSGASSNPTLVPVANIVFGGSGANRTVTVTPALNQTGTATITVTVSDGSLTASKSFVLTVNPAGAFTPVYLALEAESATLVAPMAISSDANASGGKYIAPTANDSGTATFTINIPVAGTYSVWCKVLSPNNGQDSFFVTVDGGTEFIYETIINSGWSSAWQWTFVNADMVNPSVFNFSAGQHIIQFRSREAYTALDQLLVTNDPSYVPDVIFTITTPPPLTSSIALDPAGFITVTWPAVPGKTYRVAYKSKLTDTAWTSLQPDVTSDSSTASQSDYVVGNRFYQVTELP